MDVIYDTGKKLESFYNMVDTIKDLDGFEMLYIPSITSYIRVEKWKLEELKQDSNKLDQDEYLINLTKREKKIRRNQLRMRIEKQEEKKENSITNKNIRT